MKSGLSAVDELIRIVASDLDYLANICGHSQSSDDDLRRSSAQLRFLLVEQNLLKAWRLLGLKRQPTIIAPRLETVLHDQSCIWFAVAGGGAYQGVTGSLIVGRIEAIMGIPLSLEPRIEIPFEEAHKHHYPFKLTGFLDSCGMVVDGKRVRRSEVIKYVANKLGGVHYGSRKSEKAFAILDDACSRLNFFGKNPVYYELLSIAQLVANAPEIQKFRKTVRVAPSVSVLLKAQGRASRAEIEQ